MLIHLGMEYTGTILSNKSGKEICAGLMKGHWKDFGEQVSEGDKDMMFEASKDYCRKRSWHVGVRTWNDLRLLVANICQHCLECIQGCTLWFSAPQLVRANWSSPIFHRWQRPSAVPRRARLCSAAFRSAAWSSHQKLVVTARGCYVML